MLNDYFLPEVAPCDYLLCGYQTDRQTEHVLVKLIPGTTPQEISRTPPPMPERAMNNLATMVLASRAADNLNLIHRNSKFPIQ